MPDRPLRYCDICGGIDDHPRHVIAVPSGGRPSPEFLATVAPGPVLAAAELASDTVLCRHMDCCAEVGCEVCAATEAAAGGVRGQVLIDAIADGVLADVDSDGLTFPTERVSIDG